PLERYQLLFELAAQVAGFPRHIGTHLGGLVLSREPLARVAPLERAAKGVTILSVDKDDVEALGLIKLDLLSLRTLSAVGTATRAIQVREPSFRYEAIPLDDRDGLVAEGGLPHLDGPGGRPHRGEGPQ